GELKPERSIPGRSAMSLLAEAAYLAIQDAGLTKGDIDGMILEEGMAPTGSGYNPKMAEYMGIFPTFATGCDAQGAAGVTMAIQAAAYVNAGLAKYVLCGMAAAVDPNAGGRGRAPAARTDTTGSEFVVPFGSSVAATGNYAM